MNNIFNNPDLFIAFREYNPADPLNPGPLTRGKIFAQGLEHEIETVTNTDAVPAVTTTHSGGSTSTTAAHTITQTSRIAKQFTVFYCYSEDGEIKKVLPEHITVLNYKTI